VSASRLCRDPSIARIKCDRRDRRPGLREIWLSIPGAARMDDDVGQSLLAPRRRTVKPIAQMPPIVRRHLREKDHTSINLR